MGGARVGLQGVNQTAGMNEIMNDSALFVTCSFCRPLTNPGRINSTLGDTSVETLSRALIRNDTTVGNLMCDVGADAVCLDTSIPANSGGGTGCSQCFPDP